MSSGFKKKGLVLLLFALIAVFLSSCSAEGQEKLWLKSEGWSRGVLLGDTAMASPSEPVVDQDGGVFILLFPRVDPEVKSYLPTLVHLSPDAAVKESIPLDFEIPQPRQAKLVLREDHLDLFWIDSNQLKVISISPEGETLSEVQVLSEEKRVDHFEVAAWSDGYDIWYAGSQENPGLYALSGKLGDLQKTRVDPEGIRPTILVDREENLHVAWMRYPISYGDLEFLYLQTRPMAEDYEKPVLVYDTGVSPSVRVDGPALGFDTEVGYVVWSEAIVSGLDAGMRYTYFRYFPIGEPEKIRPRMTIRVPYVTNLPAAEYDYGTFQTGDRVYLSSAIPTTSSIENPSFLPGQFGETAIVFRARSEFKWRDFRNQVNVAFIEDGLQTSYQALSYTSAESYYPSIISDGELNLYITWLEKGEFTYRAYLTTTAPAMKATTDLVSGEDYLYLAAEGVFGLLAGLVLSPFAAAAWGGIGMFGLAFNLIFSRFSKPSLRSVGEVISMLASVGIFWFMKWATLPGLKGGTYVPFSAWIPRIPQNIQQPLVIGVPIAIALTAFLVAYFKTYGKKAGSPINFHLIYCAVDSLLSCAVYGVLIYGSF